MIVDMIKPANFVDPESGMARDGRSTASSQSQYYGENMLEIGIEFLFHKFSQGMKIIGPFFAFALIAFIFIVTHTFFDVIIPFYKKNYGIVVILILTFICLFLLFNILFNYILAVLVRPGSGDDVVKSKYYKSHNAYNFSSTFEADICNVIENMNKPSKKLANETAKEHSKYKLKNCLYCRVDKPVRSHHCAVCGYCVFKMDHHCPWINNCVGQNNHRYFVLFLTHLLIGCFYISCVSIPLIWTLGFRSFSTEFNFVAILSGTGFILMIFFNSWNWFLVLNGNTTIEFWSRQAEIKTVGGIDNFNLGNWRENLYVVFGTKSLVKAIFIPSIRKLPYSGLEWSRLVDHNYKIIGLEANNGSDYDDILIEDAMMTEIQI